VGTRGVNMRRFAQVAAGALVLFAALVLASLGLARSGSAGAAAAYYYYGLPSTKDECKDGGWATFGVFKNQGDCVSFVATGGKNPPAG
jgi:hypothetical protein